MLPLLPITLKNFTTAKHLVRLTVVNVYLFSKSHSRELKCLFLYFSSVCFINHFFIVILKVQFSGFFTVNCLRNLNLIHTTERLNDWILIGWLGKQCNI